jgi:predicted nucleic acid-binding protein
MILVDTSVLINYLKGKENSKTRIFDDIIAQGVPYGITPYTYQEILQGAKDEREFVLLKEYLCTQSIYTLPGNLEFFETAARIYFELRRKGKTPRGTIDVLIALTAMHYGLSLLHDDHDFDNIASVAKNLKIIQSFER